MKEEKSRGKKKDRSRREWNRKPTKTVSKK